MTEDADQAMRQRFLEDLPFWMNGTLNSHDAQWMDDFLKNHPEHQADVDEVNRHIAFSQNIEWVTPENTRVQRLLNALHWDRTAPPSHTPIIQAPSAKPRPRNTTSVWSRPWLNVLGGSLLGMGLAFIILSAWQQHSNKEQLAPQFRGGQSSCVETAGVRAVFKPDMPWSAQLQLLRSLQLSIVHGPNEDGEIWLRAPKDAPMAQTLVLLRNSPWVEQALPSQTEPPGACPP